MEDISLHILDLAENGVTAGATLIEITVEEEVEADRLTVVVQDNGRGMDPEFLMKALDPFTTTRSTRKVGLGLSLFQQSTREAEGELSIESTPGRGTRVAASMSYSHIDRKPMGDMVATVTTLIEGNPEVDFIYTHRKHGKEYALDTREIRRELEEIPLNTPQVVALIRENLTSGLRELA
jgi:anti-sigma regulatory factor (Ser/Thr protein kinase)